MNDRQGDDGSVSPFAPTHAPPAMASPHAPDDVIERLRRASKRGKLPGFEELGGCGGGAEGGRAFSVLVYGAPYDRRLVGTARAVGSGGSAIGFTGRLDRRYPVIVIVVLLVTLWPGVWLTHSFLSGFGWYHGLVPSLWWTCVWYLPLCLLAIPALRKQFRKSEAASAAETVAVWEKVAGLVDGAVEVERRTDATAE